MTDGENFIIHCLKLYPGKIQNIILSLTENIYNAQQGEEMIKAFCHFVIIVDLLIPTMKTKNNTTVFFVHSILHTLINLMENSVDDCQLKIIVSRYLKKFLANILPECIELLKKILILIISTLIPIAREETIIGAQSLDLLEFLIIDNGSILTEVIQDLDPFPQEPKFQRIYDVYQKLRYEIM